MTATSTCPSCHVPVLSGYTKCPKCHGLLPNTRKRSSTMGDPGGTVAEEKSSPMVPIVIAVVVAGAIIAFFALRGRGSSVDEAKPVDPAPVAVAPQPTPVTPPPQAIQPLVPRDTPRARPNEAVPELEKALKKNRLWSTILVVDDRIDLRSSTCADPAMAPTITAASASLHASGLVRLRCLDQSGAVIFERGL